MKTRTPQLSSGKTRGNKIKAPGSPWFTGRRSTPIRDDEDLMSDWEFGDISSLDDDEDTRKMEYIPATGWWLVWIRLN